MILVNLAENIRENEKLLVFLQGIMCRKVQTYREKNARTRREKKGLTRERLEMALLLRKTKRKEYKRAADTKRCYI